MRMPPSKSPPGARRVDDDFAIAVPAWRARRLRAHLADMRATGAAAQAAGDGRVPPATLVHRAEQRSWLAGFDAAAAEGASGKASGPSRPPTARQLARLTRWQAGSGKVAKASGGLRREILEAVAGEMLTARPLARGAISQAHRETVRRCREAGLPAPKAWRYRQWLKLTGRVG